MTQAHDRMSSESRGGGGIKKQEQTKWLEKDKFIKENVSMVMYVRDK